jgi:hypothetical protein
MGDIATSPERLCNGPPSLKRPSPQSHEHNVTEARHSRRCACCILRSKPLQCVKIDSREGQRLRKRQESDRIRGVSRCVCDRGQSVTQGWDLTSILAGDQDGFGTIIPHAGLRIQRVNVREGQTRHDAVDPRLSPGNQRRPITNDNVIAIKTGHLGMAGMQTALLEQAYVHKEAIEKDVNGTRGHVSPRFP